MAATETAPAEAVPPELPLAAQFDADPSDFNAVAWANAVLSGSPAPAIPQLLDQLHDAIRDSHDVLDASLRRALSAVPWVVRETDKVRQRANLLRAGVDGVGERVEGVETGVASSVSTIADADTVVRRVQRASDLLAQAVDAERLLARLDALLASSAADGSDLVTAADVVAQLRGSLAPLRPIPELADRFAQLDAADRSLEALAAPQLKKALEGRNTQAAVNARIVFDHAGRDNAFQTQYVALRGDQVAALWTSAWDAKAAAVSDEEKAALTGAAGDLAGVGAEATLVAFYGSLYELVRMEADWLKEAFPDLRDGLLPSLLCEAVGNLQKPVPVSNVFLPSTAADDVETANGIAERLSGVAQASVKASARIIRLCLPENFSESAEEKSDKLAALTQALADAVTAIQGPFRAFWNSTGPVTVRQSRTVVKAVKLPSLESEDESRGFAGGVGDKHGSVAPASLRKFRPALGDLAKDVENCTAEILPALDQLLTGLNHKTSGVGISAMKQATSTMSTVLSDRLLTGLRRPTSRSGTSQDEWMSVSGALRLLCATSALKRSWEARKESLFAVAVGTATPILEVASVVKDIPLRRVGQYLTQVENGNMQEAGIVWELVRDDKLPAKVVRDFESLDSAQDFQNLLESVHRTVYDTMFAGVKDRFVSFNQGDLWNTSGNDGEASMLGFSSSPLAYATEVADYLMTIPQQLEPFVPDEEDAKFATPKSPYVFSKAGASTDRRGNQDSADSEEEEDSESTNVSFAGMWISLLAIGTMEFYVERICSIPRLSEAGTRQLATDADYICNVIASLGVAPTREMALVCKLLECKGDGASFKEAAQGFDSVEERKICRKIAAVRGLSVII